MTLLPRSQKSRTNRYCNPIHLYRLTFCNTLRSQIEGSTCLSARAVRCSKLKTLRACACNIISGRESSSLGMAIVELQFGVGCDSFCPFFAEHLPYHLYRQQSFTMSITTYRYISLPRSLIIKPEVSFVANVGRAPINQWHQHQNQV